MHRSNQQRLSALERDVAAMRESMDKLAKMFRERGELITEYITGQMVAAGSEGERSGAVRPEDALFTFVCRRKFDEVEEELKRLRASMVRSGSLENTG